jgi:DNA-binding CsgD family transcriptional regulator
MVPAGGTVGPGAVAGGRRALGAARAALPGRLRPLPAGGGLLAARAPRAEVEPALRAAHRATVALGAGPLRHEIELLARRGRLRLEDLEDPAATPAPATQLAAFGLTRRETEVLELVAAGHTNRQIGEELFITPRTAGIHVSRILAKLGVAGRGQAAAVAHRLGLGR